MCESGSALQLGFPHLSSGQFEVSVLLSYWPPSWRGQGFSSGGGSHFCSWVSGNVQHTMSEPFTFFPPNYMLKAKHWLTMTLYILGFFTKYGKGLFKKKSVLIHCNLVLDTH